MVCEQVKAELDYQKQLNLHNIFTHGVIILRSRRLSELVCINFPQVPTLFPVFLEHSHVQILSCTVEFLKLHAVIMNHTCFKIPQIILQITFQLFHPKNAQLYL